MKRRNSWFLCVPVALICLLAVDVLIDFWRPSPERLPEQFSPAYLQREVTSYSGTSPIVFLGDSVLWGYHLPASDAAPTILRKNFANRTLLNLSYEGGSSANSYFMLRYLLSNGVHPSLVVFNVNSKETNAADSAYRRLQPSLESDVAPLFTERDRKLLDLLPAPTFSTRLETAVAGFWRLYRYRTDLREAIFGTDDAATWAKNTVAHLTGSEALQLVEHRPTADKFIGTYDLAPLLSDNIDFGYLNSLGNLLRENHIPAIAILTPTNHKLLHDFIDVADYDTKLAQLAKTLQKHGITVVNADRAFKASEFLDNDHLTVPGNQHFAHLLLPHIEKALTR